MFLHEKDENILGNEIITQDFHSTTLYILNYILLIDAILQDIVVALLCLVITIYRSLAYIHIFSFI